jgi:hypothetical protein
VENFNVDYKSRSTQAHPHPVRRHQAMARHWHVTNEQIRLTIEKAGTSAAAVRKELAIDGSEMNSS